MAGRLLWSHEGAAVPSPRNTSCLVTASVRLGGGRLFPGLPPCRRVVPHVPVPRSDNLVNLRAAAGTCSCSPTLPAGSGHGVLQCLCRCRAVPGTAVWCCLSWLLSPPPPRRPRLVCQKCKYSELGFHSWSRPRARESASTVCKSLASLAAVRALTPLARVCKTASVPILRTWSWASDGGQANICHPNDSVSKIPRKISSWLTMRIFRAHQLSARHFASKLLSEEPFSGSGE